MRSRCMCSDECWEKIENFPVPAGLGSPAHGSIGSTFFGRLLKARRWPRPAQQTKAFAKKILVEVGIIPVKQLNVILILILLHAACILLRSLRKVMAHAAPSTLKDDTTPPREGWERPPELMGYVTVEDFKHLGPEITKKKISWKISEVNN